jgi:hypothetical protein
LSAKKPGTSGLWDFFVSRSSAVSERLLKKGQGFDMVATGESLPLHGDAHVLARAPRAGRTGPWWLDVAFAETSAQTLARANGLRLFRPGACVEAYAAALEAKLAGRNAPAPLAFAWAEGFISVPLAPLEGAAFANAEQASARCADAEKSAQFYGATSVLDACTVTTEPETGVVSLARKTRAEEGAAMSAESFSSEEALLSRTRLFCGGLAASHVRAWDEARLRRLVLNLKRNRNLKRRLARFGEEESAFLQQEWRSALKN